MTKYQEFLSKVGIISEEDFNEIVKEFPDINISDLDFSDLWRETIYGEDVVRAFISSILNQNTKYAYLESVYLDEKKVEIYDLASQEELNDIKDKLSGWTISNEEELIEELREVEEEAIKDQEHEAKRKLFYSVIDNISLEELKEILKNYEKDTTSIQSC